jgi:cytochrome b pre-mRNA-processing protein 3
MIFNMFRKPTAPDAVLEAYRAIVAQSRREVFYAQWDVPDTVTGRFDMISLHLALFLRRLKGEAGARPFAQAVVDLFFRDMDRSLRELGVTDLGVPRKVKTMGNLFYGLVEALSHALDTGSPSEVEAVLTRNVFGGESKPGAGPLSRYIVDEAGRLAGLETAELIPAGLAA